VVVHGDTVLGDCPYCNERLTNAKKSVTCDHCGEGFHIECARDIEGFEVTVESHLLRSDTYSITCPNCERDWEVGFDPRSD
jgi:uncharacterized Zn-finger protein